MTLPRVRSKWLLQALPLWLAHLTLAVPGVFNEPANHPGGRHMKSKGLGRRRFLKGGAALAGWAVGGIQSARSEATPSEKPDSRPKDLHEYGERSRFETAVRTP